MNKIRILSALMALLLCLSMLLTACGNKNKSNDADPDATKEAEDRDEASDENEDENEDGNNEDAPVQPQAPTTVKLVDIMNKNWKSETSKALYSITQSYSGSYVSEVSDKFLVTQEYVDSNSNNRITRVYNLTNDNLLVQVRSTAEIGSMGYSQNYVDIISDKYFAILNIISTYGDRTDVERSDNFGCDIYKFASNVKYTLTVYNAEAVPVKSFSNDDVKSLIQDYIIESNNTTKYNFDKMYEEKIVKLYEDELAGGRAYLDLIVKNNKVYRTVEGSAPVLVKNFGISSMPEMSELKQAGENYVWENNGTYVSYDKNLNEICRYILPGYAVDERVFVLSKGNILAQYSIELTSDAYEFDYSIKGVKYKLVTVVVSKDGASELQGVNYYISAVKASAADADGQKTYADDVENLVFINYISDNKSLDNSDNNKRLVKLSGDGNITAFVETGDKIIDFPEWVNDDCFAAPALGGTVVYNENGEKTMTVSQNDNFRFLEPNYLVVLEDGIYNFKNEKVYDLKANNAVGIYYVGDYSAVICTRDSLGDKYVLFSNGKTVEVENYFAFNKLGYYVTRIKKNQTEYTYKFFNADGKEIWYVDSTSTSCDFTNSHSIYGVGFIATCNGKLYKLAIEK